jgi:hypothetical protein
LQARSLCYSGSITGYAGHSRKYSYSFVTIRQLLTRWRCPNAADECSSAVTRSSVQTGGGTMSEVVETVANFFQHSRGGTCEVGARSGITSGEFPKEKMRRPTIAGGSEEIVG